MMELRFVVHGRMTSSNAFKAVVGGQLRKTKDAREDAARVREVAIVSASSQGWEIPEAVSVTITAWNSRLDADNVSKIPCDAIKGIAWLDDADVMDIRVRRRWDREGERYEITVMPSADQRPGRALRAIARHSREMRAADELRSGDVLTFDERDILLRNLGVK